MAARVAGSQGGAQAKQVAILASRDRSARCARWRWHLREPAEAVWRSMVESAHSPRADAADIDGAIEGDAVTFLLPPICLIEGCAQRSLSWLPAACALDELRLQLAADVVAAGAVKPPGSSRVVQWTQPACCFVQDKRRCSFRMSFGIAAVAEEEASRLPLTRSSREQGAVAQQCFGQSRRSHARAHTTGWHRKQNQAPICSLSLLLSFSFEQMSENESSFTRRAFRCRRGAVPSCHGFHKARQRAFLS